MAVQYQAVLVKAPEFRQTNFDGTANTASNVIYYTCVATAKCNEIPSEFWGKYVRLSVIGANMWFVFTDKSTHVIDRTIAATDAGTRAEGQGGYVASGGVVPHVRIPEAPKDGKMYFSRQGDAAGTVYMELASD